MQQPHALRPKFLTRIPAFHLQGLLVGIVPCLRSLSPTVALALPYRRSLEFWKSIVSCRRESVGWYYVCAWAHNWWLFHFACCYVCKL